MSILKIPLNKRRNDQWYATVRIACNDVFNRVGMQFREAFTFARELGVKDLRWHGAALDAAEGAGPTHQRRARSL